MAEAAPPRPGPGQGPRAVWMIRAGENGEAEQLCLEHGICGIGWPDLPDLSGMGEEAVEREIDVIYGDQPNGRISNWKMQVRHFMSISDGDIVLMPLKTKKDRVAVGRIVGPYERRTDLSVVTGHVRPTEWVSQGIPRQLLSSIKGSLNRPVTISPTPVGAEEIEELLETGEALQPPPEAGDRRLADLLEGVLQSLRGESRSGFEQTVSKLIPAALVEMLGEKRPVTNGIGIGRPASAPWVAVHGVESTGSGEEGIYAVYLFATDGSAVYLSVNQGTENVRGGLNSLVKRARDIRTASGLGSPGEAVDLREESEAAHPIRGGKRLRDRLRGRCGPRGRGSPPGSERGPRRRRPGERANIGSPSEIRARSPRVQVVRRRGEPDRRPAPASG